MCRVQKGKELNDFQRNLLDIEILSNLSFGSLEIRDTSVTRVTNNFSENRSVLFPSALVISPPKQNESFVQREFRERTPDGLKKKLLMSSEDEVLTIVKAFRLIGHFDTRQTQVDDH